MFLYLWIPPCIMDSAEPFIYTTQFGFLPFWWPFLQTAKGYSQNTAEDKTSLCFSLSLSVFADSLSPPVNVTISAVKANSAVVTWDIHEGDPVIGFAITQQVSNRHWIYATVCQCANRGINYANTHILIELISDCLLPCAILCTQWFS